MLISLEFKKYSISTFFSFLIDIFFLYILTEYLKMYYLYSSYISIIIGFTLNYFLNTRWVFNKRKYKQKPLFEYAIMVIISLLIGLINIFFIWLITHIGAIYYLFSKILASAITFIIKFYFRKIILFK